MKIEITQELDLSPTEQSLLSMHSYLNIMNVLNGACYLLAGDIEDDEILLPSLKHCQTIAGTLSDRNQALDSARNAGKTREIIFNNLAAVEAKYPELRDTELMQRARKNFESICNILDVRAREILAREEQAEDWVEHAIDQLTNNFINVFTAIEQNAAGRYHIVYNIASLTDRDYLVSFNISGRPGNIVCMPLVFQDVMRDLIANARKYTPLGGTIVAGLQDDGKTLRFVVSDTGFGIPEDQIEQVVRYGQRARNVMRHKTMGGGFGLTKAYYVTRQFGGRMWIESEIDCGTKITIEIPQPD